MPPALDYGVFFYTNSEITIYYLEGTQGWGSTFGDRPTSPFIPWGMFVSFSSDQYTYADTGNWLGILEITHDPWVWCAWVPCWFSIPAQTANSGRGWVYPPDPVTLQIVPIDGTNWGYSFALYKWLYLTASGWVYLM